MDIEWQLCPVPAGPVPSAWLAFALTLSSLHPKPLSSESVPLQPVLMDD